MFTKIIINESDSCYSWSQNAVLLIMERKGINPVHLFAEPRSKNYGSCKEVTRDEFLSLSESEYRKFIFLSIANTINDDWKGRHDPDAIAVLEEYGSEFCSGRYSHLVIKEYDDFLFIPEIKGENCGHETLELKPNLTEQHIRMCANKYEIIELLRKMGVLVEKPVHYM